MQLLRLAQTSFLLLVLLHHEAAAERPKDNVRLLHLTVASKETDGLKRLLKSAQIYGIKSKVLGMGEPWEVEGKKVGVSAGGPKVAILKKELENYKHAEDIILFTDGYDVMITGNEDQILKKFFDFDANIVFSAENICWPDENLKSKYPPVVHGYPYLNSGGFIGYAPALREMLQIKYVDGNYDQLYFSRVFVNSTLRSKYDIKLDTQAKIFQCLWEQTDDVELEFLEADTIVYNKIYDTRPIVIHGNGIVKVNINSLGNYLAKNWIKDKGCTICDEGKVVLSNYEESKYPKVLIGIFITAPTPFLEEMLAKVSSLSYPKRQTYIFVYNKVATHSRIVRKWVKNLKDGKYSGIKLVSREDNLTELEARNLAIDKCLAISYDAYFYVDSQVHLDNPHVLEHLISYNRSIIAPIITRTTSLWSTFWGAVTNGGYYKRSSDYMEIAGMDRRGVWNVPYIYSVYLISKSILENPETRPKYEHEWFDLDLAMPFYYRKKSIFMYATNLLDYGHLVGTENVRADNLHGDLWQLATNSYDWERKYLHPQYYEALAPSFKNEMPCTDVYWFPIFTERFASDIIEEMENKGEWSGGKNEDPRLSGGYENVPTDDIHLNQIDYEETWLHILKKYVKPLAEKVFIGYKSDANAQMNFVARYKPTGQSFLRPHHDTSTYTINVGLNLPGIDFEGGGSNFIRQNCSVKATKVGWALMHPGRLTHYHEGLPTTKGTRYILVSFVDP